MIKDNQKMLNRIQFVLDAFTIVIAYLLAYYLRFYSPLEDLAVFSVDGSEFYDLSIYAERLIIIVPLYMIIYYFSNLYRPKMGQRRWTAFFQLIVVNTLGIAFFFSTLYLEKELHISRSFFAMFYILNVLLAIISRYVFYTIIKKRRAKGKNLKHVLIVGYSKAAESYIERILGNPQWGYYIHGILDDKLENNTIFRKVKILGSTYELEDFLAKKNYDEIAISLSINEYDKLEKIVSICEKSGVHTKFIPDYHNFIPTKPYIEDVFGLPIINIRNVPLSNTHNRIIKRICDFFASIIAIIIFAIPMAIVALIIKISSPGPVIYKQARIGRNNKKFKMYKFRSMEIQPKEEEKKAWTTPKDPRVTKIGKFIRRTSIDELPQLFNVLKGEMSLVGPRPERPYFVEKFKEEIPRYMIKHQVLPGMTGWAQINGYRGDTSIRKRIEHDLYYIENWTLGLDFKIMFLTVFRGFISKNAY